MLAPRKTKHRKSQRGDQIAGKASRKTNVDFGEFGLKSQEAGWVSGRQIEAARRVIAHEFKRAGKTWIRIFPDKSITVKGSEIRMGGGKGAVDHYVAVIKPGMVLFEVAGVSEAEAKKALKLAGYKLSVKTNFVIKK